MLVNYHEICHSSGRARLLAGEIMQEIPPRIWERAWANVPTSWAILTLVNVTVSFAFVYIVRLLFNVGNQFAPAYFPKFPDGPWPDLVLFVNLLALAFLLEIALSARHTITRIQTDVRQSIAGELPVALKKANMDDILSRVFLNQRADEELMKTGAAIVSALRKFAESLPEVQRSLILWFVANRLPNELRQISHDLRTSGLQMSIGEEIDVERYMAQTHRRFRYVERAIPDDFETNWTPGWISFLRQARSLCPDEAEVCIVTSQQEFRTKRESFQQIQRFLSEARVNLYWCDVAALEERGITGVPYSAIASYSDEIAIITDGVGTDGNWTGVRGNVCIKAVDMSGDKKARAVFEGIRQYRISARDALRTIRSS